MQKAQKDANQIEGVLQMPRKAGTVVGDVDVTRKLLDLTYSSRKIEFTEFYPFP